MEKEVEDELKKLQEMGVISPVKAGATNSSPVVWVRKPDGTLRLCADYKMHVNKRIKTDAYPTPPVEKILSKLKNAKKFAKLDLRKAYFQIELDKNARDLCVINTSKGLFYMNRLSMGLKNASAIFQRVMETILADMKGVLIYQDDVCVYASDEFSLKKRLEAVTTRLKEKKVTLNEQKCIELTDELAFLGFIVSAKGIEPDRRLVDKVLNISVPNCRSELEHFLGLANYFGRLIPNFSSICLPLNHLRKKEVPFTWSEEANRSFVSLKQILASAPLVQPYSVDKEATLTCDASKGAIGAVLTQNGQPVIYVSRTLSAAESRYSNIEREALALTWSVVRLKHFLLGRSFSIVTDHKPLQYLFGKSEIPTGASARIGNWVISLLPYDFEVRYSTGKSISHADAMSRVAIAENEINSVTKNVYFEAPVLAPKTVAFETQHDTLSQNITKRIIEGNWSKCSQAEKPFFQKSSSLTVNNGMIYAGTKLFVPPRLRYQVFEVMHLPTHTGMQSTLRRVQQASWWPNMSHDIEKWIRDCQQCNNVRPRLLKSNDHWPESGVFSRVHIDFAFMPTVGNIFVLVDSYSGWIEAFITPNRSFDSITHSLRTVFTRFGAPAILVSDNAKEFVSKEFNDWLLNQGIRKIESPPYSPRSNGVAERAVRTVKLGLKSWSFEKTHQKAASFLQKLLFHYRISTIHHGKSPAEWMLGRKPRVSVVAPFSQGENIIYDNGNHSSRNAIFIAPRGRNTSWILQNDQLTLASHNQLASSVQPDFNPTPSLSSANADVPIEIKDEEKVVQSEEQSLANDGVPRDNPEHVSLRRSDRSRSKPNRLGFDVSF